MHVVGIQFMIDLTGRIRAEYILEKFGLCQPNYRGIPQQTTMKKGA